MGERGVRGTWGREGEGERESMCFREALQVQARLRLSFPFSTTPCTCPAAELYLPNSPPWRSGGRHSCCRWPGRSTQLLCSLLPHPPPMHSTPRAMRCPPDASQCPRPRHLPSPRPQVQESPSPAHWHQALAPFQSPRRRREGLPPWAASSAQSTSHTS